MPVMLQVRNLPDDVHAKLKRRAADAGLSLSDYVARELTHLVGKRTVAEVFEWVESRPLGITRADIDAMRAEIRAERDAR